jgi:hypothetical protein
MLSPAARAAAVPAAAEPEELLNSSPSQAQQNADKQVNLMQLHPLLGGLVRMLQTGHVKA